MNPTSGKIYRLPPLPKVNVAKGKGKSMNIQKNVIKEEEKKPLMNKDKYKDYLKEVKI